MDELHKLGKQRYFAVPRVLGVQKNAKAIEILLTGWLISQGIFVVEGIYLSAEDPLYLSIDFLIFKRWRFMGLFMRWFI